MSHDGRGRNPIVAQDIELDVEVTEFAPEVVEIPISGPSSTESAYAVTLDCRIAAWDENGWDWWWTYNVRMLSPSGGQLAQRIASHYGNGHTTSLPVTINDPVDGDYRCTVEWYVDAYPVANNQATARLTGTCPGESSKSKIRQEYADYKIAEHRWPSCSDLRTDYSSDHFGPTDFNVPQPLHHNEFWVTGELMTKADTTYLAMQNDVKSISGYRCPEKKNEQAGSQFLQTSYHLFGRAMDFKKANGGSDSSWRNLIMSVIVTQGGETATYPSGSVHGEWEG